MEISNVLINNTLYLKLKKHNPAFDIVVDSAIIENSNNLMVNYKTIHGDILGYIINIYELGNDCKEWALKLNYTLMSYRRNCDIYLKDTFGVLKIFKSDSEIKSIIKSTEYIIKQLGDDL